jgi:hypothetical protein
MQLLYKVLDIDIFIENYKEIFRKFRPDFD